jgi:hypothetical protein
LASTINAKSTGSGSLESTADASGQLALQANGATIATISSTGLAVTGAISSNGVTSSPYTMKNRIINGAMVIDQRNAGASINPTDGQFSVDRFVIFRSQASKLTAQQNAGSVTPPAGFSNYLGITSSSSYSVVAGDYFLVSQRIEGYNMADLAWGTANAKTITLSFWVRSSLTGTFGGSLQNASQNRAYPFTYTISSANTWTQVSVTIPGCTDGTWSTTNSEGIGLYFGLGVGSTYSGTAGSWVSNTSLFSATGATSVVGTNGATWYITGVQLEVGSSATSFEWRPFTTELQLCQRYYQTVSGSTVMTTGHCRTSTAADFQFSLRVTMRSAPSLSSTLGSSYLQVAGSNYSVTSIVAQDASLPDVLTFRTNVSSGLTAGYAAVFGISAGVINGSAEL